MSKRKPTFVVPLKNKIKKTENEVNSNPLPFKVKKSISKRDFKITVKNKSQENTEGKIKDIYLVEGVKSDGISPAENLGSKSFSEHDNLSKLNKSIGNYNEQKSLSENFSNELRMSTNAGFNPVNDFRFEKNKEQVDTLFNTQLATSFSPSNDAASASGSLSNIIIKYNNNNEPQTFSEMLKYDNDESIYDLSHINIDNCEIKQQTFPSYEENQIKSRDDCANYGLAENLYNISSQDLNENPYDLMINAFTRNMGENLEMGMREVVNNNPVIEKDDYYYDTPDLLDISKNITKHNDIPTQWDLNDSQESEKSDFLEEDLENLKLLKDTLFRGKLTSDWQPPSKELPAAERLERKRISEKTVITLAKARQEQMAEELNIIELIDKYDQTKISVTDDVEAELEKDRQCDEIAKTYNMIWRRPKQENKKEMLEGPILDPPSPNLCKLIAFTPAGQKYTGNLMEGRPNKFKNVGAMMMWDIATKINMQRMISQIEDGSFLPLSLDCQREQLFWNSIKLQKKRLKKWLTSTTWTDTYDKDISFLLYEKKLLKCERFLKKWRADNYISAIINCLEIMKNIPVKKQHLLKNPQIISTLKKISQQKWQHISQRATNILSKYEMIFNTTNIDNLEEHFKHYLSLYVTCSGHLKHLYQKMLVTSHFYHVPESGETSSADWNDQKNDDPQNVKDEFPQSSFCWD